MKLCLSAFVLLLLLPITVFFHFSVPARAESNLWTVDDDGPADFSSIREAVNSPDVKEGDTIFVHSGTYEEWNITLRKDNLSLVGENRDTTIIDGLSYHYWILIINARNVTVTDFTIQNSPVGTAGIHLNYATESRIGNNLIRNHDSGIYAWFSNGNVLENNWVTDNNEGIILSTGCKENKIRGNNITGNTHQKFGGGVDLTNGACDNEVEGNNIIQNKYGIIISHENNSISSNNIIDNEVGIYEYLEPTRGYKIFHNNFVNNTKQVELGNSSVNVWDIKLEGNYWSNYNGTDFNQDGIGDTQYFIEGNNTDHYPLMGRFSDFSAIWEEEIYHITTICNSTIEAFQFHQINKTIKFDVTVEENPGFCRVRIPVIMIQDVWHGNYTVLVDGESPYAMNNWTDTEHTYIYFSVYQHSEHEVLILPETSTWVSMLLMLIVLAIATATNKRRSSKTLTRVRSVQ